MGDPQAVPPQDAVFDDAVFDTNDGGLDLEAVAEPEFQTAPPRTGSSQRSMSQACKGINTKLHWLRLLLP
jgi:hypothetical protein